MEKVTVDAIETLAYELLPKMEKQGLSHAKDKQFMHVVVASGQNKRTLKSAIPLLVKNIKHLYPGCIVEANSSQTEINQLRVVFLVTAEQRKS